MIKSQEKDLYQQSKAKRYFGKLIFRKEIFQLITGINKLISDYHELIKSHGVLGFWGSPKPQNPNK